MSSLALEAVNFFGLGNQQARQLAGRDVRMTVDLFADEFFHGFHSPSKRRAILAHTCLRDAVGEKDDAIFALHIKAGVADDAILPAFGAHLSLCHRQFAVRTNQQKRRVTVFDNVRFASFWPCRQR